MKEIIFLSITGLAPVILLLYALIVTLKLTKDNTATLLKYGGFVGILASVGGSIAVAASGTIQSGVLGWQGLGLSLRLDSLSMTMMAMIAILGLVIIRYSINYLDGDVRKNVFLTRLATTIASVELLVISGNLLQIFLFWTITSICLHYLLVFYRNRPQAVAAARKKFFIARLADISLFVSFLLIYLSFGTGNLEVIFSQIQTNGALDGLLLTASIFLVIAALLKSAQFPTHGWLIEVVETPTPVSALLHAGLLNAGPFLIVRMSFLMTESTSGSMLLIVIGGLTALLASIIYLTQPSIKVALGYSSIAHMGFSLLICGFGIYSAALLHVIAHSFYKAHSFLSSGSVIDSVRARKIQVPKRTGNLLKIVVSILVSGSIFLWVCQLWGMSFSENFGLMATGAIIVMGLAQMIVSTLDTKGTFYAIAYSLLASFFVTFSFFTLEHGVRIVLGSQLPLDTVPDSSIVFAATVVLVIFSLTVLIQLFSPRLRQLEFSKKLGVHFRNGLYTNVIFDRMIGSLKHEKYKWANLSVMEETSDASFRDVVIHELTKTN